MENHYKTNEVKFPRSSRKQISVSFVNLILPFHHLEQRIMQSRVSVQLWITLGFYNQAGYFFNYLDNAPKLILFISSLSAYM